MSREQLRYDVARLHRRGASHRAIARALHIDRRTVAKLLEELAEQRRGDAEPRTSVRAPRPSKLDRFADIIDALVTAHPDIRATRVHEELRARGFDGGYTIVREYLRDLPSRTKPARRAQRVETAPGHQAQADFSPYELDSGLRLNAFSVVLSYSRYLYMDFTTDQRQPTIFRQLVAAFEAFGGVPEEIVFDSMPGIVDRWELDRPILNLRALDFAAHYGFCYHIAPRGDGAYKGKVERPFRYCETSFFNGRTLYGFDHARAALRTWLEETANARRHGAIGGKPVDRFDQEKPLLHRLPGRPYDTHEVAYRIVDGFGRVHFDGNTYSTPSTFAGRRLVVRASERAVILHEEMGARLCEHARAPRGARLEVTAPEHALRTHRVSHDTLLRVFEDWGQEAAAFARAVVDTQRERRRHLAAILALQDTYSAADIVRALEHAARYRAYDAGSVTRILEATAVPRRFEDRMADKLRDHVRDTMAGFPVARRETSEYARLLGSSCTPGQETDHEPTEDDTAD